MEIDELKERLKSEGVTNPTGFINEFGPDLIKKRLPRLNELKADSKVKNPVGVWRTEFREEKKYGWDNSSYSGDSLWWLANKDEPRKVPYHNEISDLVLFRPLVLRRENLIRIVAGLCRNPGQCCIVTTKQIADEVGRFSYDTTRKDLKALVDMGILSRKIHRYKPTRWGAIPMWKIGFNFVAPSRAETKKREKAGIPDPWQGRWTKLKKENWDKVSHKEKMQFAERWLKTWVIPGIVDYYREKRTLNNEIESKKLDSNRSNKIKR